MKPAQQHIHTNRLGFTFSTNYAITSTTNTNLGGIYTGLRYFSYCDTFLTISFTSGDNLLGLKRDQMLNRNIVVFKQL